ncbi:hypothetical protein YC2023_048785 [Brassica napus]
MLDFWSVSGSQSQSLVRVNVVLDCCSLPSSSFPVTASVASISAVRRLVDVADYQLLVSPNKSGCGLDVEVLVVPVRRLQAVGVSWCL